MQGLAHAARQQRQHHAGGDHADGGLYRGAAHQPDAVHEGAQVADVERGLVAVEADIGERDVVAQISPREPRISVVPFNTSRPRMRAVALALIL